VATVAIVGGTGFLGSEIVRAVSGAGLDARIASRRPPKRELSETRGSVSHVTADVRDEQSLKRALEGASAVVNAVSLYVEESGATFEAIHVEGAARVARCAREARAEIHVHISGLGTDAASPSAFVRARARGEHAALEAFERSVVMSPGVMFGRGDRFLTTIEEVTRLPVVPVFGDGETRLQPAFVADVAAAVAKVIEAGTPRQRLYELGGAEILSYRRILRMVMDHLGRRRVLLPLPFALWKALAGILAVLPTPPLTRDQVILMENDNVVTGRAATFFDLGLRPAALSSMLAQCLPPDRVA
jgi:NADH dehydrogenase